MKRSPKELEGEREGEGEGKKEREEEREKGSEEELISKKGKKKTAFFSAKLE